MPALSYQPRFVEPLLNHLKLGTIRALRKNPPRPGQRLFHYVRQRMADGCKIGESDCVSVTGIKIWINSGEIRYGKNRITQEWGTDDLDAFAQADGFNADMKAFWIESHGVKKNGVKVILLPFVGMWIQHTPVEFCQQIYFSKYSPGNL